MMVIDELVGNIMKKKIIIISTSVLIFLAVISMAIFFPLYGKEHIEVWSYGQEFYIDNIQSLEKNPNEDFTILQLSDIQLWMNIGDNQDTLQMIRELVDRTKPNLIILVGDNVSGLFTNLLLIRLIGILDSFEIPWAPVFGNHDVEGKATLNWQGDKFEESEYCLFKKGPSNLYGVGNYVINITENSNIVQTLFFFDNGRYYNYDKDTKKEIYMGYEQMAWYKWNIEGIAEVKGEVVPSMTFSHFAIPEFATAIETLAVIGEDGRYYVPEELGFGSCLYIPGVAPVNSGFFDLCKELGSTHSMFFGHDHENDASIKYEGINLTYGLKSGPSPAPWNNAEKYGGTTIVINGESTNYSIDIVHEIES